MLFCNIDIIDENFKYKKNQYVAVKNGRIDYIGSQKPQGDYGENYDGIGKLLMSGFFNTHAHMPMALLRGYAEKLPLRRWLDEKVFPFEAVMKLDKKNIYKGTMLSIAESLRFGTVGTTNMYFDNEEIYNAVRETGIKCNTGNSVVCFDDSCYWDLSEYKEFEKIIQYHNAEDGRFKIDLTIHAEYSSTQKVVEQIACATKENGLNMTLHLSETKKEHEECKMRHGKTPAKYFYDCGVFDSPTTAAHCVWLEDEDFDLLAEKGVTISVNSASNLKLGSGIADISKMLKKGINVSIGTDSVASNNNLNMMKEIYLFALLPKATTFDATAITPEQALAAATANGAKAQGRPDCGVLKVGNRADLIVLDTDVPYMYPKTDMICNLVYSAQGNDVVLTMVDGNVLYKNGEYMTLDIEKVKYEADKATEDIIKSL